MINSLFYAVLVACFLSTLVKGRKDLIYAIAFLMPMNQVMPSPIGMVSTPVYLVLAGLWGATLLFPAFSRDRSEPTPFRAPLLLFMGCVVLGLVIRGMAELRGVAYLNYFWDNAVRNSLYIAILFLIYRFTYRAATPVLDVSRVVLLVQVAVVLQAAVGTYEKAAGSGRACAQLGEDNLAGSYFASGTAFFLAWFLMAKGRRRWFYLAAMALTITGLFATLSRGGMLASVVAITVVAVLFFLFVRKKSGTKVLFLVLVVLAAVNAAVLVPDYIVDRILYTFQGSAPPGTSSGTLSAEGVDSSSGARLEFWGIAWERYKEQPWGYGPYTFPTMLFEMTGDTRGTHSAYFQALVELGTQGIVSLLLIIIAVYSRLMSVFLKERDNVRGVLALSLVGWWTAHVLAHIFLHSFFDSRLAGQFWVLLAIAIAPIGCPAQVGTAGASAGIQLLGVEPRSRMERRIMSLEGQNPATSGAMSG